jgi:hypothetical protein
MDDHSHDAITRKSRLGFGFCLNRTTGRLVAV